MMKIKANYFSPNLNFNEKTGQVFNHWGQFFIRPIDASVEQCTKAFAPASSSLSYKVAIASLHALASPFSIGLYALGVTLDKIGDSLKARTYNYLEGNLEEKKATLQTPFSLLSANICMLPYGICTWAGMSPAQERIDEITKTILEANADFLCLQEVAPYHANAIWKKIQNNYAHGFSRIGPMPINRMNGGLFFASKYPIEKTLYYPLPNKGPIPRGIFCIKTHIGWILIGHLHAGSSDADALLRKEQVASIQKLCAALSENGKTRCLVAMDANIKRTGQKDDEYTLSEIPKHFYDSFSNQEPFSLREENATCTNIQGLALQGKHPKNPEDEYEHIDYVLSYKASDNFLSLKTRQIPTNSPSHVIPLSDHKFLLAEGSFLSMASLLEETGNVLQYLIPIVSGGSYLLRGHYKDAAVFATAGLIHQIGFPYLKRFFPNSIRPNGKKNSFPSGHTSAAFLGVSFLLARGGSPPLLITVTALAALTAFSRWYTRNHFPKDLLGGSISGTILGLSASAIAKNI